MTDRAVVGVVLAGGRARRMGGREKAFLPLAGGTLMARAARRLKPQCDLVIINGNGDPGRFAAFGLPVVNDSVTGYVGPLAGILAGLDWIADHTPDAILVSVPVDGPFFPDDLCERLHSAAAAANCAIACAQSDGRRHGIYGLWPVAVRNDLRKALVTDGIRKVDSWLAHHSVAVAEWSAQPIDPFFNVNTPDDLTTAEQYLRASAKGA